ncbi:MAG: RNA-binding protein [Euryarchaeota archaeon]|nr:RNA-binding protein [Euryarchaeota archaeon]MBT86376.1 RNA-binding protein [Euryarchaeota archaeon]DAC48122.1 MAG TPA: RNA-binding protein [Candidatus Poseidoniales archaeon]HII33335.1 RNA-binding protein [Candidatus Thalassarchaeaceae archaeon]|tara:strand:- start:560 stop:832 length:273 start_codon:yes stop_codon:yes gene_type:complete
MSEIPGRIIKISSDPNLPITVRIGKSGVINSVIEEISDQLSSRSLVKIKLNRGIASDAAQRSELFSSLASSTSSKISFSRGNVVVLWSGK